MARATRAAKMVRKPTAMVAGYLGQGGVTNVVVVQREWSSGGLSAAVVVVQGWSRWQNLCIEALEA